MLSHAGRSAVRKATWPSPNVLKPQYTRDEPMANIAESGLMLTLSESQLIVPDPGNRRHRRAIPQTWGELPEALVHVTQGVRSAESATALVAINANDPAAADTTAVGSPVQV